MKKIFLFLLAFCLIGCATDTSTKAPVRKRKSQTISNATLDFFSLPSPMELSYSLQRTGIGYAADILHNPDLGGRYSTILGQALNLGIYGADLSYSIYFDQQQVALSYMGCVKTLAQNLDVMDIVSDKRVKDLEDNLQDKEMLKKIVAKTFFHSDAFLKESNRSESAAMIMAGAWLEALHISTELSQGDANLNPNLTLCIMDQRLVLSTLQSLLKTFKESQDSKKLLEGLAVLDEQFTLANQIYKVDDLQTEEFQGAFKQICSTTDSLRTQYIKMY